MVDGIQAIGRVTYNTQRIEPVRRRSKDAAEALKASVEAQSEERQEINKYLKEFSANPDHLSFAELLKQAREEQQE